MYLYLTIKTTLNITPRLSDTMSFTITIFVPKLREFSMEKQGKYQTTLQIGDVGDVLRGMYVGKKKK
ncbi:MAG: hypothetical protein CMG49_05435 [Candidatus Marinimicrobia bacterium]|nr:hypothetical protein [Candidatus Neomarinimicrobiota bacterium]